MEPLFGKLTADKLSGAALDESRQYLIRGLRQATGIPFELCGDANSIHCTDICTRDIDASPFTLTWQGFIGSSDYRDDNVLVFGAHLFPLVGGIRACLVHCDAKLQRYDYAYRYLMLTVEDGWKDIGWQVDEYGEFEHWYREVSDNHAVNRSRR